MKKTFSTTTIILCLFFFQVPYSFCQNTQKEKPKKEANRDDTEDEGDIPKEENASVKKKANKQVTKPVSFGIEAGLNISDLIYGGGDGYGLKTGGIAGVLVDIHIVGGLYIQPGLFYAMNGGSKLVSGGYTYNNDKVNINTIDLPVGIIYKFGHSTHFFIGASTYLGYNFSGTYSGDGGSGSLKIGSANTDDIKALDLGLGLNIGLELKNGLFFCIKDREGISNLAPYPDATIKTSSFSVEAGFLFGKKVIHKRVKGKDDDYVERKM